MEFAELENYQWSLAVTAMVDFEPGESSMWPFDTFGVVWAVPFFIIGGGGGGQEL